MSTCHTCPQEIETDNWLYCGRCGAPVRLPCPYDGSHNAPSGMNSGGRCPNCDRVLRYCPKCGSIFTIRDVTCTRCGTALLDFSVGYDHFRGGIDAASGSEMPGYSFKVSREDGDVVTRKFNQKIGAPITSYGSLFFFIDGSRAVWKLNESLIGDPLYSPSLESIAPPDLLHTNLSAGRGLIGVLLQDRAVLLDAVGLSIIAMIPGRFGSQVFTSETYYLFGSDERPEGCPAKAVDPVTGRVIADCVVPDMRSADMLLPVSDGEYVYVLGRSGRLVRIIRSDNEIEQTSRMLCEGETLGQPILLGARLYSVASKKRLIRADIPGFERIRPTNLETELTSDDICGTDGAIVVQEPDQVVYLGTGGNAARVDRLPPKHSVKDVFVAKFGRDLVTILHLDNPDPRFESFRCWDVASGSPRNTQLRVVSQKDAPGFIVSNGAVYIFSRSNGEIARYAIGGPA